jgi:homoserine dehydrogenase
MDYAAGMGMTLRYMTFAARKENGAFTAYVEPSLIPMSSLEASVHLNNNMASLFGEYSGRLSFYGQGAGKYPTGNALAQDIIDIVNGDTSLSYAETALPIDNSGVKRAYFIRTRSALSFDFFEKEETVDGVRYIFTKETGVADLHRAAEAILAEDGESFFAGIEND